VYAFIIEGENLQKEIFGYEFQFVEEIQPERDEEGRIKIYLPQQSYKDANQTNVHKHGWGPFCKFRILREWEGLTGVYLYLVEGKVKYVGEAKDFGKRVNAGYGIISPRNCFKGGQITNCRINNRIFKAFRNRKEIELYFYETDERRRLEKKLIEKIRTEWNRESLQYSREKVHTNDHNIDTYSGKYLPLESYLKDSRQDMIEPSFEKIENILSFKLPKSAKKYNAWWSGKKRSHTKA